jgi:peptidoglycan/LPS O-acetylase OafA/YrhL
MSSAVYNPWTLQNYFQTYAYTAVYSSNLGFDEFFFFSAMLMTLKMLEHTNGHQGNKNLGLIVYLKMFAMRFIRLAPIYYLVFFFGWQVGPYLGSGPCWFTYEKGYSNCSEYWWSVLTMTINFFPDYAIANEGCYYWGWYPPCELQLFLVMPWIAYLLLKIKSGFWQFYIISLGVVIGIAINFYIIWVNEMAAGLFAP